MRIRYDAAMSLFAAAATSSPSALERLRQIPLDFWLRVGLGLVAIVVVVLVLRKVAKVNKLVLALVLAIGASIVGFNWIYERNEPAWATPVVEWLAGFFPTKGRR